MRNTLRLTTGAAVLGVVTLAGAPAAMAQTSCSAYSGGCDNTAVLPDSTRGAVAPTTVSRSTSATPSTLPFTGSQSVAIALAGAGALAAGTVLVVVSRRRAAAPVA